MNNEVVNNINEVVVEEPTSKFDKFLDKYISVRIICGFVSILASISATIFLNASSFDLSKTAGDILGVIFIIIYIIGMLAALIACPLKLISAPIRWAIKGFEFGFFIPGIGCLIGACIGFVIGAAAVLYAPAVIAIPNALFLRD